MQERDRDSYLRLHGEAARPWLNRCVTCGHVGYKPEMPESLGVSVLPRYLRRYYAPQPLDDRGMCQQCAAALPEEELHSITDA